MPNDFITLNCLAQELNDILKSGKIDKIHMPEKDEITLNIRLQGQTKTLAVSCNANNPRIHLTQQKKENPLNAPNFCMNLRKHLLGGIIQSIQMLGTDRIIQLQIISHNEMRDQTQFFLVAEMMGRYSNIMLVNSNNTITATLKQASFDAVTKRCLLPSVKYELPEQSKILPTDKQAIISALKNFNGSNILNYLTSQIAGLSGQTAKEILHRANISDTTNVLDDIQCNEIYAQIEYMLNVYNSTEYRPCVKMEKQTATDFFVCEYSTISNLVATENLNQSISLCVSNKDIEQRQGEHTKHLQKALNSYISRTKKKLAKANEKLTETQSMDTFKLYGDLIISNLYLLNKGQCSIQIPNYFESDNPLVTIKLNEQLTPQQNAQSYYKRYAKLKRTKEIVSKQLIEIRDLLQYLDSLQTPLKICNSQIEIAELEKEMQENGIIKKPKNSKTKSKAAQPITYLIDDFVVCVGKNNIQNEKLTFKLAGGSDMWFHAKNYHGSHTIIFAEGRDIPENVIQIACEIAAYYSQGNQSTKVEIDYTRRRNLKRHPCGKLGMVTYSDYKTAFVQPNNHLNYIEKQI